GGSRRPCLSTPRRATFPAAALLEAPASSPARVEFQPARLLALFPSTAIPAQSRSPEKRGLRCLRLRSEAPRRYASACCEIFRSTPVASSITSKLDPP